MTPNTDNLPPKNVGCYFWLSHFYLLVLSDFCVLTVCNAYTIAPVTSLFESDPFLFFLLFIYVYVCVIVCNIVVLLNLDASATDTWGILCTLYYVYGIISIADKRLCKFDTRNRRVPRMRGLYHSASPTVTNGAGYGVQCFQETEFCTHVAIVEFTNGVFLSRLDSQP